MEHQSPFVCFEMDCAASFSTLSDIRAHFARVHCHYAPFECSNCRLNLSTEERLFEHWQMTHKNDGVPLFVLYNPQPEKQELLAKMVQKLLSAKSSPSATTKVADRTKKLQSESNTNHLRTDHSEQQCKSEPAVFDIVGVGNDAQDFKVKIETIKLEVPLNDDYQKQASGSSSSTFPEPTVSCMERESNRSTNDVMLPPSQSNITNNKQSKTAKRKRQSESDSDESETEIRTQKLEGQKLSTTQEAFRDDALLLKGCPVGGLPGAKEPCRMFRASSDEQTRLQHMPKHHANQPFWCTHCSELFKNKSQLKKHRKKCAKALLEPNLTIRAKHSILCCPLRNCDYRLITVRAEPVLQHLRLKHNHCKYDKLRAAMLRRCREPSDRLKSKEIDR